MIALILQRIQQVALALLVAGLATQTLRLHFAHRSIDNLRGDLRECTARTTNMELRRGVEEDAATRNDLRERLWQRD